MFYPIKCIAMKIYNLSFLRSIPIISGLLFQLLSCNRAPEFSKASQLPDSWQNQKRDNTGTANSVFKSTDGGQSWQDISKGLFVRVGNGLYHSTANAAAPFWNKEIFPDEQSIITSICKRYGLQFICFRQRDLCHIQ